MTTSRHTASGKGWTLHCCDCAEWMAEQPEASVDHVICDPPYDERTHKNARSLRSGTGWTKKGIVGRELGIDFAHIDPADVAPPLVRLAARWALAFCSLEQIGAYAAAAGDAWVRAGIAHRRNGAPQFTGDRPAAPADGLSIMHRTGRKKWNGGGHQAFWSVAVEHHRGPTAQRRLHPTQKPLPLMLELVRLFTDPGELICDPFAGSGTTGVAALRLGRRFVGCEISEDYWRVAVERLRAEESHTTVGAARAGQVPLFAVE